MDVTYYKKKYFLGGYQIFRGLPPKQCRSIGILKDGVFEPLKVRNLYRRTWKFKPCTEGEHELIREIERGTRGQDPGSEA